MFVAARARSSAEEHYLDMVGVTGSIPVAPTTAGSPDPLQAIAPQACAVVQVKRALGTKNRSIDPADAHLHISATGVSAMKVRNSLKSLRGRHRNNRLVRRRGRVYVINKVQRRFKARQG